MSGSDDYGGMSGDEEANRYAQMGFAVEGALANNALEEMAWLNRTQHSYEQDDDEEDEYEQHQHHEDQYEPPVPQQDAPEPTSAPFQLNVSQPAPPTPQIQVSHAPPSSQTGYSGDFSEVFAHDMGHGGPELPEHIHFGSTPYGQPSEDPAPPGMPGQLSSYAGGSVAVEASPSVQPPTPAPDLPRHMEYSETAHQKRARKSASTSSSSGHHRRHRKHHHTSKEHGHGSQGPSVPQGIPQTQQPPMQGTHRDEGLLGISHFGPGGQVQPHRGSSYGHADPHRRANTSEVERISHAYASQQLPELRPDPFAGMQRSAPSSYMSGAGPGYGPPPQGESSSQGAGRSQLYPAQPVGPQAHFSHMSGADRSTDQPRDQAMQNVGPSTASMHTGGTRGAGAPHPQSQGPQSQGESSGQGASHSQALLAPKPYMVPWNTGGGGQAPAPRQPRISEPGPTRGMDANALWSFMTAAGPPSSLRFQWRGSVFDVARAEIQAQIWSEAQMHELSVIIASFGDWHEVAALGQRTPGGRSAKACAGKAGRTVRLWNEMEDAAVCSLTSSDPQLRLDNVIWLFCQGREADEIVGRFILFRRSSTWFNLGNGVGRGRLP